MAPFGGFYGAFRTATVGSLAPPVVGGIANPVPLQRGGGFRQPIAVQGHLINAAYHGGGLWVDHPKAGVLRVFEIAIGRWGQRHPGISFQFVHDFSLFGNISGIIFVHDIFEGSKLVFALVAVHPIGNGHQPHVMGREKFFRQAAYLNVIPAQAGKVFHEYRRYVPALNGLNHLLKTGPLHGGACDAVVHKKQGVRVTFFFRRLLENFLLRCNV